MLSSTSVPAPAATTVLAPTPAHLAPVPGPAPAAAARATTLDPAKRVLENTTAAQEAAPTLLVAPGTLTDDAYPAPSATPGPSTSVPSTGDNPKGPKKKKANQRKPRTTTKKVLAPGPGDDPEGPEDVPTTQKTKKTNTRQPKPTTKKALAQPKTSEITGE